jgi:hypothetical protein
VRLRRGPRGQDVPVVSRWRRSRSSRDP